MQASDTCTYTYIVAVRGHTRPQAICKPQTHTHTCIHTCTNTHVHAVAVRGHTRPRLNFASLKHKHKYCSGACQTRPQINCELQTHAHIHINMMWPDQTTFNLQASDTYTSIHRYRATTQQQPSRHAIKELLLHFACIAASQQRRLTTNLTLLQSSVCLFKSQRT